LLDNKGHVVHIDFGFYLTNSPGGMTNFTFESAPFKLTKEYVEVMGGPDGEMFDYFKSLLTKAFFEVRKHIDDLIAMIQIMFN
jgi:phosphatidylinositol kinase/protein kinase (PI-3  family)